MSRRAAPRLVPPLCLVCLTGCYEAGFQLGLSAGRAVTGRAAPEVAAEREPNWPPRPWTPPSPPAFTQSPGPSTPEPGAPSRDQSRPGSDRQAAYDRQMVEYNRRRDERAAARREREGGGAASGPSVAGGEPTPGDPTPDVRDAPGPPPLREPAPDESGTDWAVRVLNTADESDWVARRRALEHLEGLDPAEATPERREAIAAALAKRMKAAAAGSGFDVDRAAGALLAWAEGPDRHWTIGEALLGGTGMGRKETLRKLDPANPDHAHVAAPLLTHPWEGKEALAFVRGMGTPAEPAVLRLLDDPNPATRRDVASLLAEIGGPASAEALLERAGQETDRTLARHLRVQRATILNRKD